LAIYFQFTFLKIIRNSPKISKKFDVGVCFFKICEVGGLAIMAQEDFSQISLEVRWDKWKTLGFLLLLATCWKLSSK